MSGTDGGYGATEGRRRWFMLVVLCIGQLMIVLDSTVVNVALPVIQRELHFSEASLAWVINAYLLTFGGLLLLAGRFGDLVGRTQVFLAGLAAFTLSSLLCGLAPTAGTLVAARFVQGASAAMIGAMALGIISPMFPKPRERALALSIYAFVAVGGASIGLVLGGAITAALDWHWIFFINVPVGLGAFIVGRRILVRHPGLGIRQGADVPGALLVTAAPMLAVLGLIDAGSSSWTSASTIAPLLGSVVLAVVFVAVETRAPTPLVPLRIFRHRNLVAALLTRILFPMGGYGLNFLGALYLEHVLGYSPLRTGIAFLPSSVTTGVVSLALMPMLVRRVELRTLIISGLACLSASLFILGRIAVHSAYAADLLPTMLLSGIGFGLVFMPSVSIAMSDVAPDETGLAAGISSVAPQLGASIGVAALATISAARTAHQLAAHESIKAALTGGYRVGFIVAGGIEAVGILVAVAVMRPRRARSAPSGRRTVASVELVE